MDLAQICHHASHQFLWLYLGGASICLGVAALLFRAAWRFRQAGGKL